MLCMKECREDTATIHLLLFACLCLQHCVLQNALEGDRLFRQGAWIRGHLPVFVEELFEIFFQRIYVGAAMIDNVACRRIIEQSEQEMFERYVFMLARCCFCQCQI